MIFKEDVEKFKKRLKIVYDYAKSGKLENPNWHYDNKDEYKGLFDEYITISNKDITENEISMLAYLQLEVVSSSINDLNNNITNKEHFDGKLGEFYNELKELNSSILKLKKQNPKYIYDDIVKGKEMLFKFSKLKTNDIMIVNEMKYMIGDIIITISKSNSRDDLNAFIDYVDSIMSNSEKDSLENEVTSPTF